MKNTRFLLEYFHNSSVLTLIFYKTKSPVIGSILIENLVLLTFA